MVSKTGVTPSLMKLTLGVGSITLREGEAGRDQNVQGLEGLDFIPKVMRSYRQVLSGV